MSDEHQAQLERERQAMEGCENEPIEFVGTIQPNGWLITFDITGDLRVRHASANLETFTGRAPTEAVGARIDDLLDRSLVHSIRNSIGHSTVREMREHVGTATFDGVEASSSLSLHVAGELAIIEGVTMADEPHLHERFARAQRAFARAGLGSRVEDLIELAVHDVRDLLGYERVMMYRFAPDGSGEVVAESRIDGIGSFLGLRFPAADIPQSARRLYATTPIRIISDTDERTASVPVLGDAPPPDLGLALLRGTVPVHNQYLRNMGVRSSLSLPVVVDGAMWGLFACHDRRARSLTPGEVALAEVIGWSLSTAIDARLAADGRARRDQIRAAIDQSIDPARATAGGQVIDLSAIADLLVRLTRSDGLVIQRADTAERFGDAPPAESIAAIEDSLEQVEPARNDVRFATDLASALPAAALGPARGALMVRLPLSGGTTLLFFRNEAALTVTWAGAPGKDVIEDEGGLRLNPRASFESYLETVDGQSLPWTPIDVAAAGDIVDELSKMTNRVELDERIDLLMRELNHRVRNILSVVRSIAHTTGTDAANISDFTTELGERLDALQQAHALLTDSAWTSIDFAELFGRLSRPFVSERDADRIQASGPPLPIAIDQATVLTLVVHELLANAARHGALSNTTGRVVVTWSSSEDGASIHWTEAGGPAVSPPTGTGFGLTVIREGAAHELGGIDLDFAPEGLTATIQIPPASTAQPLESHTQVDVAPAPVLADVLLVEDDHLVALETRRILDELGASKTTLVGTVAAGAALLAEQRFSLAVLDLSLRDGTSLPLVDLLQKEGIPFLIVTGHDDADATIAAPSAMSVLRKPISRSALAEALGIDRAG